MGESERILQQQIQRLEALGDLVANDIKQKNCVFDDEVNLFSKIELLVNIASAISECIRIQKEVVAQ